MADLPIALPTASEIETRAKALGRSMTAVCREAGIHWSTWYRWRAGTTSPSIDVCSRLLDATADKREVV